MDKRERRYAILDAIPGSKVALLIIFRGGWIDAISSYLVDDTETLETSLIKSKYMEEIQEISIGDNIASLVGIKKYVLEDRLRILGKRVGTVPKRSSEQARTIIEGLGEYLARSSRDIWKQPGG